MAKVSAAVLTARQLNRALLARQMLLDRPRLSIPTALERMGGLQAQYAPAMYIGLWSRIVSLRRDSLTTALERRKVAQGTLLRATIHLVSAREYWTFALGTRAARRAWWLRAHPGAFNATDLEAAARRLRTRLDSTGSIGRVELQEIAGSTELGNGVGLWLDLVRVPPTGTWHRRRADLFAAAEDWLGPPPVDLTPDEALEQLVRRYLGGFGPATRGDIASWAGVPVGDINPVVDRMTVRRFRSVDGQELVDLPRLPLPDPETPAPPRFLAVWDAILLVHARPKGILREEHRPLIFNTKMPQSANTFLVDGVVAGTWRYADGGIRYEPFGRLSRAIRAELDDEAERLSAFHT